MGQFHNHEALDGKFAVKLAKFKQANMLDALVQSEERHLQIESQRRQPRRSGIVVIEMKAHWPGDGIR